MEWGAVALKGAASQQCTYEKCAFGDCETVKVPNGDSLP